MLAAGFLKCRALPWRISSVPQRGKDFLKHSKIQIDSINLIIFLIIGTFIYNLCVIYRWLIDSTMITNINEMYKQSHM